MQQVFVEDTQIEENLITVVGEDAHHLSNVLRMKMGETLRISNQSGESFLCEIKETNSDTVLCEIIERNYKETELKGEIILFQALPKGERLEFVTQKATELGVTEIYPVAMDFCVTKWEANKAEKKRARYQAIADAASKQSKRSKLTMFNSVVTFDEALKIAKDKADIILLPYENEEGMTGSKKALDKIKKDTKVAIFIGPEGGFSEKEIEKAKDSAELLSLGKRILRTDTAAILSVGMVMLQMELDDDIS